MRSSLLRIVFICSVLVLTACQSLQSEQSSLYQQLGGKEGITRLVDIFIYEIGQSEDVVHFFEDTNIERFREKQIEHICLISDGPCAYTGDTMERVHDGMKITETDFNNMTNVMIVAMDKSGISLSARNQLLARIAELHHEVIYR